MSSQTANADPEDNGDEDEKEEELPPVVYNDAEVYEEE